MRKLSTLVTFLDKELAIDAFDDSSNNGLQVESQGTVRRICCGVDASMEFFKAAADRGADLLICHHGISWRDSLKQITGVNYRRIRFLLEHDMALYAAHLPLDAHRRYGNNACIARALGLQRLKPFGLYHGKHIGFLGTLPAPLPYSRLKERVRARIGTSLQSMDCGRKRVQSVAIISGGAPGEIEQAAQAGADVYLSGEPSLAAYILAQEYGINGLFAGHYATERFGVQAIATLLQKRFNLPCEFVDLNIKY